ncbi:MAG TPA: cystine ABC transporter substrate-binding protein [Stellaceae bacterium]|nr:cystine ABC transporter substrate-binding protein [Stellaceae bacterium]
MCNSFSRRFFGAMALAVVGWGVLAGASSTALAADPGVPSAIATRGTLVIGVEGTYPPFNYQDESGHLVGFEIDFAKALTAKLGLKPDFKPTKWDGMLAALTDGRLDVVINQVTITPARQKIFDFSVPYTISGSQIITLKSNVKKFDTPEKLAHARVGVGLGTNYEQWLHTHVPTAEVRTYDDDPSKYQDLRAGRIDAALNDRLVAADFIKKSGGPFAPAGAPFDQQESGVALRKNAGFKAAIDKAIEALRADGTLTKISVKWFGIDVTH